MSLWPLFFLYIILSQLFSAFWSSPLHFSSHPLSPSSLPSFFILHNSLGLLRHYMLRLTLLLSSLYFSSSLMLFSHLYRNPKHPTSFTHTHTHTHRRRTGTCVESPEWSWWWLPSSSYAGLRSTSLSSSRLWSISPPPRCRLSPGTSALPSDTPTGSHNASAIGQLCSLSPGNY